MIVHMSDDKSDIPVFHLSATRSKFWKRSLQGHQIQGNYVARLSNLSHFIARSSNLRRYVASINTAMIGNIMVEIVKEISTYFNEAKRTEWLMRD